MRTGDAEYRMSSNNAATCVQEENEVGWRCDN